MNGFIARTLGVACLAGLATTGCEWSRDFVDPCSQERYSTTARREVMDAFAPQVQNGHVLDQTVFNYCFDKGTDKLNPLGIQKLHELTQRRPQPDPNIFLATATDFDYNPENPDAMIDARRELDQKRVAAIQRYLTAQMAGRPLAFDIAVHDPYEVGANGQYAAGVAKIIGTANSSGLATGVGSSGTGTATNNTGSGGGGNQTGQMGGSQSGQSSSSGAPKQ